MASSATAESESQESQPDEELILMERDLCSVPQRLAEERGPGCRVLNLKENRITNPANLALFTRLEMLVLDKNGLKSLSGFPAIETLRTLWLNNNSFSDIQSLAEALHDLYPKLEYLSLMQNPCCPSLDSEKVSEQKRYRNLLAYKLPCLRHLDFEDISAADRVEAEKRGPYLVVRRPKPQKPRKPNNLHADISPPLSAAELRKPTAILGMSGPRRYDGSQSEGNRFISNQDL